MFPPKRGYWIAARSRTEYQATMRAMAEYAETAAKSCRQDGNALTAPVVDRILDDLVCMIQNLWDSFDIARNDRVLQSITREEWHAACDRWGLGGIQPEGPLVAGRMMDEEANDD